MKQTSTLFSVCAAAGIAAALAITLPGLLQAQSAATDAPASNATSDTAGGSTDQLTSGDQVPGDVVEGKSATDPDSAADKALPEGTVAIVNGVPISQLLVDSVVEQLAASEQSADPERVIDELINLEVLTQKAEAQELDQEPPVAAALRLQYTQTMANAYLASEGQKIEVSEADLKAEYDRQTANMDRNEFRASHILLETEEAAADVIKQLAEGADFATLAREQSIDPAGENGGDLGWFQVGSMVPEFTDAVAAMEKGDISATPVETQYGFHVIRLDDKREAALPDFESVKPGLTSLATRNQLAERVETLRGEADIQR